MSTRRRFASTLAIAALTLAGAANVATAPSRATPPSDKAAVGVVVTHGRTEAQIRSALASATYTHHGLSASYAPTFATPASYVSPYAAGKLTTSRRNDALRALKAVRYLAGVPTNISFTSANNSLAQHCSVLLAATGQFAHVGLTKPAGMSNSFFAKATEGCAKSNLYSGLSNLSHAVLGWAADPGANNLGLAGHRGWQISTAGDTYGIGYGTHAGRNISALHTLDNPACFNEAQRATNYVAWPNSGAFPLEYFWGGRSSNSALPWSVYLGNAYQAPDPSKVIVVLVRVRDDKTWRFTPTTQRPNGTTDNGGNYLNVNPDQCYGMARSIQFRPSQAALGTIRDGDKFTVTLRGITSPSGNAKTLKYSTTFFKLR